MRTLRKTLAVFATLALSATVAVVAPASPAHAATIYWHADHEEGPSTGTAGYVDWSFVQAEDSAVANPALNSVVSASNPCDGQGKDMKLQTDSAAISAGKKHSKVYKEWVWTGQSKTDQFGRAIAALPGNSINGTYGAWYCIPTGYTYTSTWTNLFQFKLTEQSPFAQNPQLWVNLIGSTSTTVKLHVEDWDTGTRSHTPDINVAKGSWFEISAKVAENSKIDWYINGMFWQTTLDTATQPIGRDFDATGTPQTWVFGVGHYDGARTSPIYIDDATFCDSSVVTCW